MKRILSIWWLMFIATMVFAQNYKSNENRIWFYSEAPLENIEATTNKVYAEINYETGSVYVKVPIESFVFDKELMQEHFNDQYLESWKYPLAEFSGSIVEYIKGEVHKEKSYKVKGNLTIHGVSKSIETDVKIAKTNELFVGTLITKIQLSDYKIKIPRMVIQNIAEVVDVTILLNLSR